MPIYRAEFKRWMFVDPPMDIYGESGIDKINEIKDVLKNCDMEYISHKIPTERGKHVVVEFSGYDNEEFPGDLKRYGLINKIVRRFNPDEKTDRINDHSVVTKRSRKDEFYIDPRALGNVMGDLIDDF